MCNIYTTQELCREETIAREKVLAMTIVLKTARMIMLTTQSVRCCSRMYQSLLMGRDFPYISQAGLTKLSETVFASTFPGIKIGG